MIPVPRLPPPSLECFKDMQDGRSLGIAVPIPAVLRGRGFRPGEFAVGGHPGGARCVPYEVVTLIIESSNVAACRDA